MKKISILFILLMVLSGCGFHLRGCYSIPKSLKILKICPYLPFDPFQRALKQMFRMNGICVVENEQQNCKETATLVILSQGFSERVIAYASDGQASRSIMQFTVSYHIVNREGKILVPNSTVQRTRELTIFPNAILGTDNERLVLKAELINDATLLLARQLESAQCL